jgi:hypothetical protein
LIFKTRQISDYIDKEFREYAIYTIANRGIPSFYDSLTPLQRLIVTSTYTDYRKSLNIVGEIIKKGYIHGNSSIENGINRLARPYLNSYNLLHGDGFFGNPINPHAAQCRYTSVKIDKQIKQYVDTYSNINPKGKEYFYEPLHLDMPIGLLLFTIGIAVGFSTRILPRNLDEILRFLDGDDTQSLKPFLSGYKGKIIQADERGNCWLFKGNITYKDNKIRINNVPQFIKYKNFLVHLNEIITNFDFPISFANLSKNEIEFELTVAKENQTRELKEALEKSISVIITENIVFTADNKVLEYANIKDYLIDFRNYRELSRQKLLQKNASDILENIKYIEAKIEFIDFMLVKQRTEKEIKIFLEKYNNDIQLKLDNVKLREITFEKVKTLKNETLGMEKAKYDVCNNEITNITEKINKMDFTKHNTLKEQDQMILKEFQDIEEYDDANDIIENEITDEKGENN